MKAFHRAPPPDHSVPPVATGPKRSWRSRLKSTHARGIWWWLLDKFESSRRMRRALYLSVAALVAGGALWFWGYPWWAKRNAVRIAQAWLASGHLRYAADAAQQAMNVDPTNPEPWRIAAELARRGGQHQLALDYSRRAAQLAPADPAVVIGWAAAALRADAQVEADRALDTLPAEEQTSSPYVLRLRGELARRQLRLTVARNFFEAARRLEGAAAINEVPLGLILLNATDPAERQLGLDLLGKWSQDGEWGLTALRSLLEDALVRNNLPALRQWAEALRAHPGCTVGDMPKYLLALSKADGARYAQVLAELEKDHAVTPQASAQLLSWLNEIGRGADAVPWLQTLPAAAMQRPPLAVGVAEALRQSGDWSALKAWTQDKDWGTDADFLRWAYGLQAAHMLGETAPADALWSTLYSHAQVNGVHALFSASLLYSWGRVQEGEDLWWRAAEQEGQIATDALGALARHYQTHRDAEGQYRVFRRLHFLKPGDRAIGNNFAFFAALTGRETRLAEQIAHENMAQEPKNPVYAATLAFTVRQQGRTEEAMGLIKPFAKLAKGAPAVGFSYGLTLADAGHTAEARQLLQSLPPESLTLAEIELIRKSLGD